MHGINEQQEKMVNRRNHRLEASGRQEQEKAVSPVYDSKVLWREVGGGAG